MCGEVIFNHIICPCMCHKTIQYNGITIIIRLYCHIQRALHDELECSLALTHIVPMYTIK